MDSDSNERLDQHVEPIFETRAELDLPGETGRHGRVFAIWAGCLMIALVMGVRARAHIALGEEGSPHAQQELARARATKAKSAMFFGLALPALLTWALSTRYRRGGRHARGIVVDVTNDGHLRMWGRGYGVRVVLNGAEVRERLVDVYAGGLGAWRQRRIRVRGTAKNGGRELELATRSRTLDEIEGLPIEGGEGDCVELGWDDFRTVRTQIVAHARPPA